MSKTLEFDWEGKPGLSYLQIPIAGSVGHFRISVEITPIEPDPKLRSPGCCHDDLRPKLVCGRSDCIYHYWMFGTYKLCEPRIEIFGGDQSRCWDYEARDVIEPDPKKWSWGA